jgi:CheY-like chemotaxis protein
MTTEGQRGKTILVVEDDNATREALAMILSAEGFTVVGAPNGQEALSRLRSDVHPDLILLDLMMPVMDGWQFRREQKQDPAIADIPLVVITATGKRPVLIDAAELVMKPLDLNRLFEAIERYC